MDSLARPPHRRKHSTIKNGGISFKNPYEDVLLSNGGKRNSFQAHEYAEIFSGSSSIPVLDIPGLDERVGSGDRQSSKLDYSSIFGGLGHDDVTVPYEELFNGSAKKSKTRFRPYRTPADARLPFQESGSLHSSGKTRASGEASDQSIDGTKQQFNMSFNGTSQRNIDVSNGKTHVAQPHAVSGFTYFVDGNLRQKTEGDRPVPSLKHEVSRTWSFSADVEAVKGKSGLSCDKSHNANDDNLKSNFSKVPPPSSHSSDLTDNKTPTGSSAPNFASKEDVSKKNAGKPSPPFSDEEFEENSVAAVSAAALKKAIDQAQESIRIAKMIMERKKEGFQDSSKPRSRGLRKVLSKETKIDHESYGSKENNASEKYEAKDPIIAGIDGKVTPPLGHNDTHVAAGNTEVERVRENVEAAKEHGEAFARGGKLFASNCSNSEALCSDEKVELKKLGENVEAAETHGEATYLPGLVANGECKPANLKSEKVGYNSSLMLSMSKLAYHLGGLITGKEWREISIHNSKEPEVGAELLEQASKTPERMQNLEKSAGEAEQCKVTFDHLRGPESGVERVLRTSQRTREQEEVVDEPCESLRIIQDNEVTEERESDTDDKGKHEEMLDAEDLTARRSEFDNPLNETRDLVGNKMLAQEEMKKISENVSEWKENGQRQGRTYAEENEEHPWFESKEKLEEVLEEDNNGREPDIVPEIGEVEKKFNEVYDPENDDKKQNQNHAYDGDEPELAGELDQNKIEERHMNTSEYDAAETIVMEGNNYEFLNSAAFWDAEGTNNTLGGAEISEENHNKGEFWEAAYEEDIGAVDVNCRDASAIVNDDHTNDTGTIFSKAQEACSVDLNSNAQEYQKAFRSYKENDTETEVNGTFSAAGEDMEAERLFHLQDNEMPGMDGLRRSASEEIFLESKLHNTFEVLSVDGKTENVGITDADPEEKPPAEDAFEPTNAIPDAAQTYDATINGQNLPEVGEIDLTDVRQVLEQTSELDEESVSTTFENIDELSAHESEESVENTEDKNSNKEELKDELEMVSNGRKSAKEQSEGMYSQLHSEPKEMEKSMETERPVERGVKLEKNNKDVVGTTPMEENDANAGVQNSSRNDHQQRIEAIKREREREKDRIAVERAIREARERAFTEARERAERAAVERAAAEVRQRVMAEAREKLGKTSGGKQPADKASTEAKLRAERAAVERATAEARERALEKAMSQKTYTEGRTPAERYTTEKFSSSSRNNGLNHSFSSSDLENGMNTESAQRRKARLERHQRITERAAKALEEKNMRDRLAQREQAERNRLAESLDADIKRWATGKEGNLRALLSTLQYILGPDSGWQPISLTEIITTAAVKKAYRKATLYVHPDKLQQRGASIQQKYICEKVFDLLKAAWNRFNSEER
ncbi:Auxilin-like protein and related proteins containing DnaJ domain [Handroanthus impetiginosus]|uniref:Auxilin-like protein and related proteins containing DnaJ domain n=1 Tax=Handroanthus impetiginosus TaxID=429701 RepID=A0A2G9H6D5_9LAMI|nr:Auxilin-like protein and related proteins containing DnaJ domain [Handroanthus impetiginosus]